MESLKDIADRQQLSRSSNDDPLVDQLLAEVVRLAEEVCVLRDRLDSGERLSRAGCSVTKSAIDEYEPSPRILEQRLARHRAYFEELFAGIANAASSAPQ